MSKTSTKPLLSDSAFADILNTYYYTVLCTASRQGKNHNGCQSFSRTNEEHSITNRSKNMAGPVCIELGLPLVYMVFFVLLLRIEPYQTKDVSA